MLVQHLDRAHFVVAQLLGVDSCFTIPDHGACVYMSPSFYVLLLSRRFQVLLLID